MGKNAIFLVFGPKLTVFKHGQIYLGPFVRNGHFGLKSISLHLKVDEKSKKLTHFLWKTQLKFIKRVFAKLT